MNRLTGYALPRPIGCREWMIDLQRQKRLNLMRDIFYSSPAVYCISLGHRSH
jgi:hypothetical protein